MDMDELTNKAQVHAKFGDAKYFVLENGTNSEVFPVDDPMRNQAGTARFWFVNDQVVGTSCYMTNK
jgi:hypothetical protein